MLDACRTARFRPDLEGTATQFGWIEENDIIVFRPDLEGTATNSILFTLFTLAAGSDPTLRGRRHHCCFCGTSAKTKFRPDLEGTAIKIIVKKLLFIGKFRPDLEGTAEMRAGCWVQSARLKRQQKDLKPRT